MDLAIGAKRTCVMMEHLTKSGESKIVERCTYPLTAKGVTSRVYTDLAVIDVTPRGFVVIDMVPGLRLEALQERTDAPLHRVGVARVVNRASEQPRTGLLWVHCFGAGLIVGLQI